MHQESFRYVNERGTPVIIGHDPTWGFSAGIVGSLELAVGWRLTSHILYSSRPGRVQHTLPGEPFTIPSGIVNDEPIEGEYVTTYSSEIEYSLVESDVQLAIDLLRSEVAQFGVAMGAAAGFAQRLDVLYVETNEAVVEGMEIIVSDGRIEYDLDNVATPTVRASAQFGTYVGLDLLDGVRLTPGLYYDYGLTPFPSVEDWQLHSFLFRCDVTMGL